jgi:hypothetical protein
MRGKVHPETYREGPYGEQKYSSTLSLTSALSGGGWSKPRNSHLTPPPPGKDTRFLLYRKLGGTQGGCGKSRPHRCSIPGPSSLWRVVIPTALSWPTRLGHGFSLIINLNRSGPELSELWYIFEAFVSCLYIVCTCMCVCVCVCVRARARACACVRAGLTWDFAGSFFSTYLYT